MQLADCEINSAIQSDIIRITPFVQEQINPNSYDLRLGDEFIYYEPDGQIIDPFWKKSIEYKTTHYVGEYFIIEPHQFVLARTIEHIELPSSICAQVGGKSSLARLGLSIHQTGGFVDAGFKGTLTLELFNANCRPIKLYSGMRIAQLMFFSGHACCKPYGERTHSKYQGQVHTELSRYDQNDLPYQRVRNGDS